MLALLPFPLPIVIDGHRPRAFAFVHPLYFGREDYGKRRKEGQERRVIVQTE
jgi:hypothetical protein